MKKSILIFILLLGLLTIPACNKKTDENADKPVKVSIVNLIANPKEYDGKTVEVRGVVEIFYEGCRIYLTKDSWFNGASESIGLGIDYKTSDAQDELFWFINQEWLTEMDAIKRYNGKYANITGVYTMSDQGFLGQFPYGFVTVSAIADPDYLDKSYYLDPDSPYYMPEIAENYGYSKK